MFLCIWVLVYLNSSFVQCFIPWPRSKLSVFKNSSVYLLYECMLLSISTVHILRSMKCVAFNEIEQHQTRNLFNSMDSMMLTPNILALNYEFCFFVKFSSIWIELLYIYFLLLNSLLFYQFHIWLNTELEKRDQSFKKTLLIK